MKHHCLGTPCQSKLKKRWELLELLVEPRFWSLVDIRAVSDCWPWKGAVAGKTKRGASAYGTFKVGNKSHSAHKFAYQLIYGTVPNGLLVCHHCDRPLCCNPTHMFIGTSKQNTQDCIEKGRKAVSCGEQNGMYGRNGSKHPSSKFTEEQVADMRRRYSTGCVSQLSLAHEFKVTQGCVSAILLRKTWRHIA